MDYTQPDAKAAHTPEAREKIKRVVAARGLGGLANDTKWNELLAAMRQRHDWRPSFRWQCVDGTPSGWDVEWFCHLPFPLISVEWMDICFIQEIQEHRLTAPQIIDHSSWIEAILRQARFDYRKGRDTFRIFGYAPRNTELFDE